MLKTRDGRGVRADYRCVSAAAEERYIYEQMIEGTPFAGILRAARIEVLLQPDDSGTRVSLASEQKLRGLSRLGGFMMRRATGRTLSEALAGLERITGSSEPTEAAG